jgi:hypothetical protein
MYAVRGDTLDPLEGTQTLFAQLAPAPATFNHGLATGLETTSNSGDSAFVEFHFLGGQMCLACLELGLC